MDRKVYEFISKQTNPAKDGAGDPIVERKTCAVSGQEFAIFQSDLEMLDKLSPIIGGKKYSLPVPTLEPYERNKRRFTFRNDSKIYRRKCDLTGKEFISMYSPDKNLKVYHHDAWFSDKRDPLAYGRIFDYNKSFFDQFYELSLQVPRLGMQIKNCENCDYCGVIVNGKNCYLSNVCSRSEEVYYSFWTVHSIASIDCFRCYKVENSYQAVLCSNSQKLKYCLMTYNCFDCTFCINLDACESCFMCHNIVNKKYCIRNKQHTKEEYLEYIKNINLCDIDQFQSLYAEFDDMMKNKVTYKATCNTNSEGVFGSFLTDSKNCVVCFDLITGEDCRYYFDAGSNEKDCMDCSYGGDIERSYETLSSGTIGYHNLFSVFCWNSRDLIYCDICMDCTDCFGCIGLRNKQYCIFNKQYTQAEYEKEVPKIIEKMKENKEWGEFFSIKNSPFGYNETVAMEYHPISESEAVSKGYQRETKEYAVNVPDKYEKLLAKDISANIKDIDDSILDKVLICEISGKPYRIIKPELEFYRKHNLPIPHVHQDIRQQKRTLQRPGRDLYLRECDNCHELGISIYPQKTDFKVFCDKCYNKEIY